MMEGIKGFLLLLYMVCSSVQFISCLTTDPQDATVLFALREGWKNLPPSWKKSDDPCGGQWEGITCTNSRVTALKLSTMGLKGALGADIGSLKELIILDLSYNKDLTGPLSSNFGDLHKLNILILVGCGFNGAIPPELGNLTELTFLALNSNSFTGEIPNTLGKLSKVYWLDLADNQLSGPIPVSTANTPGLDLLWKAKHFHLNKNKLSGTIPPKLFSSGMELIHVLFDQNQLTGSIPSTIGLVQTLKVLRLDHNSLVGRVPTNLNNLTSMITLNLGHNRLTGPLPDLTGVKNLNYVDLSNNNFDESEAPEWFSTLESLTTLVIENGSLQGLMPQKLFSAPQMQQVKLGNNSFDGTLDMGVSISQQLDFVDFEYNNISSANFTFGYNGTLILFGNPVCSLYPHLSTEHCRLQVQPQNKKPYSTSLARCGSKSCPQNQKLNPRNCECAYPYEGIMYFRGIPFSKLSNATIFKNLERSLWEKLKLAPGSVFLQKPSFDAYDYLEVKVELFPNTGKYFNRSDVQRIGFDLSNQIFKPEGFGPYYFIADRYAFSDSTRAISISLGLIAGIAGACAVLVVAIVCAIFYALRQKARAERAMSSSRPYFSRSLSGKHNGDAPQLKGARLFSIDELKKCTDNFSEYNKIGLGGYGKVYKGLLSNGQQVAIKRGEQGSKQGGHQFRTEIESLSRVHHKNLVSLLGFCFENEEKMLVYEYMPNGSLQESLSGHSGINLDWKRRLCIALGSARGLAYLHELANPPIIHRDVKSTNILLDENLTAKVADFGLCKFMLDNDNGPVSTQVKGTVGYVDPEYYITQQLTGKSDVYSFGVVMLELLTAKKPVQWGKYLVREVETIMNKNDEENLCGLKDIIDPTVKKTATLNGFKEFLELAMQCVADSGSNRPSMSEVVKVIETILQKDGLNTTSMPTDSPYVTVVSGLPKGAGSNLYEGLIKSDATDSGTFDYSGEYTRSAIIEPK